MKKVIFAIVVLCLSLAVQSTESDMKIDLTERFNHNQGSVQEDYTEYHYVNEDSDLIDYTINYEGATGSGTEAVKQVYQYTDSGEILSITQYLFHENDWEPNYLAEYEYCSYGEDLLSMYMYMTGEWHLYAQMDYLWNNGVNYRTDHYLSTTGDPELVGYYHNTYDGDNLITELIYSNINGQWMQYARNEYSYNQYGMETLEMYQLNFNTMTEEFNGRYEFSYQDSVVHESQFFIGSNYDDATLSISLLYHYVPTAVEENVIPRLTISVYPNPCKDSFKIVSDEHLADYVLYDVKGRKLKEIDTNDVIDTSNLSNGIYFIKSKNHKTATKKVVVVK